MHAKKLGELVARYQENRDFICNEETTKHCLILPFLSSLGYDVHSPREVRPEYAAEFTVGDGKRYQDKMDYAIFDAKGQKPLIVIEVKPLGTNLQERSQQLARYMSQLPDLRFGILTDGCQYLFYSDLCQTNVMDEKPFFKFSLDDAKLDYEGVAKFLNKFSHDEFNAEKLISEAEDSNYRQQMIDKLVQALQKPSSDEGFIRWLSEGVYGGKRTTGVMERLGRLAGEAVRPSIIRVLGDEYLNDLRTKMREAGVTEVPPPAAEQNQETPTVPEEAQVRYVTTDEELQFYEKVKSVCARASLDCSELIYKDTINYFNVSYRAPTKWFVRFFGDSKKKAIVLLVPTEEVRAAAVGFEVEDAPAAYGVSRVYIDSVDQVWALEKLILRSLEICKGCAVVPAAEVQS